MKVIITSILFSLTLQQAISQKDPKISIDKITGDTTIYTGLEKLYSKASLSGTVGEQLKSAVLKDKTKLTLALSVQTGKSSIFSVDKAILKLADETVVTLSPLESGVSDYSEVSYGSTAMSYYQLSESDIKKIKESPVKFIRIESSIGNLEYDLKDKFKNVIQSQVNKVI